jgi:hypothetical protein
MRLDLQLAGFQFQPLVLDALAPISEQCEPVVCPVDFENRRELMPPLRVPDA